MAASPQHRIGGWVFETRHLQWLRRFELRRQLPLTLFLWASYCALFMALSRKPYVRKGQAIFRLVGALLRKWNIRKASIRLGDLCFHFDPSDTEFISAIDALSSAESEVHQFVRWFSPGDTFIDVGANYGVYSLAVARKGGSQSKVFAFEANPRLVELLRQSAAASHLTVKVFNAVMGDLDSGDSPFFMPKGGSGMGSLFEGHASSGFTEEAEKIWVSRKSLDGFFIAPIQGEVWLKLDVEGSELFVLKGATQLLRSRPKIWMEVHPDSLAHSGSTFQELKSLLWETGYRYCLEIPGSESYSLEVLEGSRLRNVLITHQKFPWGK